MLGLVWTPTSLIAQTCTPDPDNPKWVCDVNQGLYWLQEVAATSPGTGTELDHLGISVAGWGDFNGDGSWDVVSGGSQLPFDDIQAPSCPFPAVEPLHQDKAWIVLGAITPPCTQPCNLFTSSVVLELRDLSTPGRNDRLGWRVAYLGNIDGHAGEEVAISAPQSDTGGVNAGVVYVISYRGSLPTVALSDDPDSGYAGAKVLRIRGEAAHHWFGYSVSRAGDIIGDTTFETQTIADGIPDLLVGAPGGPAPAEPGQVPQTSGRAYVIDGSELAATLNDPAFLVGTTADFVLTPGTNCVRLKGNAGSPEGDFGMRFGTSVKAIGDLDGDGRNEFAVGAIESWYDCTVGGGSRGLVYLAAPQGNGRVRVYSAGAALSTAQVDELVGVSHADWFGYSLASGVDAPIGTVPGDSSGDDIPDLLIGAPLTSGAPSNPLEQAGSAYLFSGADLLDGGGATPVVTVHGEHGLERAGHAVALGGKLDHGSQAEFAVGSKDFNVTSTPPTACMSAVEAEGLFFRLEKVGRVRIYCGSSPSYPLLHEIHGIQVRSHLGYAIAWLPPSEYYAYDFSELLMTIPGFATCIGEAAPLACLPPGQADGRREIGRAHIRLFHPTP